MHGLLTCGFKPDQLWKQSCSPYIAPSTPPPGVRALNQSSTTILVEWNDILEADRNGIIIEYEVDYTYPGGPSLQANASKAPLLLQGLDEDELYSIRVRAYTSAGPGSYSPAVMERTPQDGKLLQYKYGHREEGKHRSMQQGDLIESVHGQAYNLYNNMRVCTTTTTCVRLILASAATAP
jgi:hypothetical protein